MLEFFLWVWLLINVFTAFLLIKHVYNRLNEDQVSEKLGELMLNWFYITHDKKTVHVFNKLEDALKHKGKLDGMVMHTRDYKTHVSKLTKAKIELH